MKVVSLMAWRVFFPFYSPKGDSILHYGGLGQLQHVVILSVNMTSHATHQGTLGYSHLSSLGYCGLTLAERVEVVCVS